jgi:AcrR family transcriptional regulator
MPGMSPVHDPERSPRSDGEASRERLLRAGLSLFARQGYAKTSTRELAEAAGVNVASISYYFGDKAGLYRAVCIEPLGDGTAEAAQLADPSLDLAAAIRPRVRKASAGADAASRTADSLMDHNAGRRPCCNTSSQAAQPSASSISSAPSLCSSRPSPCAR